MNQLESALRKAAILVAAVDGRTAELLLAQMDAPAAAAVRRAAAELDDIPTAERDSVLAEFRLLAGGPAAGPAAPSPRKASPSRRRFEISSVAAGIDLCGPQTSNSRTGDCPNFCLSTNDDGSRSEHGTVPLDCAPPTPSASPARTWLKQAGSDALAECLSREQPQTIAVVFTRLPPQQAAEVLRRLPDMLQTEVVERLANTDQADPAVLRDIEQGVEAWLSEQLQRNRRATAGMETASRLLEAAGYDLRQGVLANLARRDSALARRLASSPVQPPKEANGQTDLAALRPVDVTA